MDVQQFPVVLVDYYCLTILYSGQWVDGDFKKFEGKWCVKPGQRRASYDHLIVFLRILERRPVYFSCILAQRNKHNFITSLILKCLELLVSTMDFLSSLTYHQH
jgi:hypothetical protein